MSEAIVMAEASAPRRRRFRFSLRLLAILVTVITVWLGLTAMRANRQKFAVETMTSHGGHIIYDYQIIDQPRGLGMLSRDPDATPPVPGWSAGLLSEHYFVTPIELRIHDRRLIESGHLSVVSDLPELERISISRMRLNRADLSELPPLAGLRVFRIEPSYLPSEMGLRDFSFLRGFPRLQELSIGFSKFSDDDVQFIANAIGLRSLNVSFTAIGDNGLRQLQRLTKLESLGLAKTKITDKGLAYLRSFPRLESLNLFDTQVTDDGLQHLQHLRALQQLGLIETGVTEAEVARLRKALPKCEIRFESGSSERRTSETPVAPGAGDSGSTKN
jgi:hypothetical protein